MLVMVVEINNNLLIKSGMSGMHESVLDVDQTESKSKVGPAKLKVLGFFK